MRIVIFSESFLPLRTGVAKHTYELALNLHRRGHEVILITGNFEGDEYPFRVVKIGDVGRVYANGSYTYFIKASPFKLKKVLSEIHSERPIDAFHNQGPLGPPLSMLSALMMKKVDSKVVRVGTFHSKRMGSPGPLKWISPALSYLIRQHHFLTAPSRSTAREMEELFGVSVRVVPNAIDTSYFNPSVPPYGPLMDGKRNVLYVGRFDERKGVDVLVRAWNKVSALRDDVRLVMVGDGPLRGLVEDYRKRLGNIVIFDDIPMGDERLPMIYRSSDFCVFPAKGGEAFGIVILEAFASGKTAVVSDIEGYNEVACPECALLVPPEDEDALSEAILKLLGDEELLKGLSQKALQRGLEFSWDRVVRQFEELYSSRGQL